MVEVSLTNFVDFVTKSGTPKLTVVRDVKKQHADEYHPTKDYYAKMRMGIIDMHKNGKPPTVLDSLCAGIADANKRVHYPTMAAAYKKFMGRRSFAWFDPPKKSWTSGGLRVLMNPELGLIDGDVETAVKLYFKKEALGAREVAVITHLMELSLPKQKGREFAVLDIRQSKLIPSRDFDPSLTPLVVGEAASFEAIYNAI